MVLEDEALIGTMLCEVLTNEGCIVCGPHATTADALAAAARHRPDAAVLDVSLGPDQTSLPVAKALDEAGVPFAFVTGYGPETAAVVAAYPASLVIPKPVDPETVVLLLGELVPNEKGRARGAA